MSTNLTSLCERSIVASRRNYALRFLFLILTDIIRRIPMRSSDDYGGLQW